MHEILFIYIAVLYANLHLLVVFIGITEAKRPLQVLEHLFTGYYGIFLLAYMLLPLFNMGTLLILILEITRYERTHNEH